MIFISFVNLRVKRAHKSNWIYKLSNDDKNLLWLIKKAWCNYNFLNHFREGNEQ